jgi:hypothetical protein
MELPIKESTEMCNSRPRWGTGGYCELSAGFKTDHLGVGRCYLHGGAGSLPRKYRLYSEALKSDQGGKVRTLYEALLGLDPEEVEKLDEDIALLRATMLTELNEGKLSPTYLAGYMNALDKLVRTKVEIEKGLKARVPNVAIEEVTRVLSWAINDVLGNYPELKRGLMEKVEEALKTYKE